MTSEQRSRIMRSVKGKNTGTEMIVRRIVHRMGYRYRLHRKDMPGKPDLVFGPRRKVIFVHGCFWHGHTCKRGDRTPQENRRYWTKKIARNKERDQEHVSALKAKSWRVLVIWECETKDTERLRKRVRAYLA